MTLKDIPSADILFRPLTVSNSVRVEEAGYMLHLAINLYHELGDWPFLKKNFQAHLDTQSSSLMYFLSHRVYKLSLCDSFSIYRCVFPVKWHFDLTVRY